MYYEKIKIINFYFLDDLDFNIRNIDIRYNYNLIFLDFPAKLKNI